MSCCDSHIIWDALWNIYMQLCQTFNSFGHEIWHVLIKSFQISSFFLFQCHGLWDEDDPKEKKQPSRQSESEDESKGKEESDKESEPASSLISERGSTHTLRSINFGTSIDSGHVQVHCPQQQTYQRRKSSSGGSHISHRSLHSSARSKRGEDPCLLFVCYSELRQMVQNMRPNLESQQLTLYTENKPLRVMCHFVTTWLMTIFSMLRTSPKDFLLLKVETQMLLLKMSSHSKFWYHIFI